MCISVKILILIGRNFKNRSEAVLKEKSETSEVKTEAKKSKKKFPLLKGGLVLLFVVLALFGGFYFVQYQKVNDKYQEVTLSNDEKNKRTAAKVAKLIDLPKDETPVVYVVKDKDKLTNTKAAKEFFDKAKNDDVVLAYAKADLAVIYRPSTNVIVKTDTYQKFAIASSPITIAIIANSDQQQNLANQLESKFGNIQIVSKETPKVLNGQSYVVDLTGSNAKTAQDLATQLGLQVGSLPEGETKPGGALFAVVIAPSQ